MRDKNAKKMDAQVDDFRIHVDTYGSTFKTIIGFGPLAAAAATVYPMPVDQTETKGVLPFLPGNPAMRDLEARAARYRRHKEEQGTYA
jgi:hypothetical protein